MWANFFLLLVLGGITFAGYKRGLVHEITDWVSLFGAALLSYRLYRPIGSAMHASIFNGWTESATFNCAFWMLFAPTALVLLSIGLHLDRVSKEEQRFPEDLSHWSG